MRSRKYGFLSNKNLPYYIGEKPIVTFDSNPPFVTIWRQLMTSNEVAICGAGGETLRLAKKKAFKKYRKICSALNDNRRC